MSLQKTGKAAEVGETDTHTYIQDRGWKNSRGGLHRREDE